MKIPSISKFRDDGAEIHFHEIVPENESFTSRVLIHLQKNMTPNLMRAALIQYLYHVNRIFYVKELDCIVVRELDGWRIGWYI